jgi:hypothetical protein
VAGLISKLSNLKFWGEVTAAVNQSFSLSLNPSLSSLSIIRLLLLVLKLFFYLFLDVSVSFEAQSINIFYLASKFNSIRHNSVQHKNKYGIVAEISTTCFLSIS